MTDPEKPASHDTDIAPAPPAPAPSPRAFDDDGDRDAPPPSDASRPLPHPLPPEHALPDYVPGEGERTAEGHGEEWVAAGDAEKADWEAKHGARAPRPGPPLRKAAKPASEHRNRVNEPAPKRPTEGSTDDPPSKR